MLNQMERLSTRKIDELGRIVLPSELRNEPGWDTGAKVAVYYVNDTTVLLQVPKEQSRALIFDEEDNRSESWFVYKLIAPADLWVSAGDLEM